MIQRSTRYRCSFSAPIRILSVRLRKQIEERPFDILDLNMGCPVPKVVNNRDGSALMKNPRLAGEIIEDGAGDQKPLTVKIRKGFDDAHVNAVGGAHCAGERCGGGRGAQAHQRAVLCRTCGLGHYPPGEGGGIDSVIGNGDIRTPEDVAAMAEQTGCDGYMIARGQRAIPGFSVRSCIILIRASTLPGRISRR